MTRCVFWKIILASIWKEWINGWRLSVGIGWFIRGDIFSGSAESRLLLWSALTHTGSVTAHVNSGKLYKLSKSECL